MITDSAVIEFLDDDGEPVANGEVGEIVTTGLFNYAMPMIRYKLGDFGIPVEDRCSCGRSWPLIKNIEGRTQDTLILSNGKKVLPHMLFARINRELENNLFCVSQFQIVQEKRNKLIIKIVKGKKYHKKVLQKIIHNLRGFLNRLDEEISIEIDFVEKIMPNRSGKFHKIISLSE